MKPIGIIGLGLVGQAIATRLVPAGFEVVGFDRDASAQATWAQRGWKLAHSVDAMAAVCKRFVLAVFDTTGVLQVIEGPAGLLEAGLGVGQPQAIFDCSTGEPDALQDLAARLASRGIDFIETPLSGSSQQIAAGQATALLGAEPAALDRHADLLAALATQRIHVGGAGMGARAKLATNLVLGLNRAALAEGLVFAQGMGIPPARFLELVLATPARSEAAAIKGPLMVSERFAPQSRIRQHLKDVELMLRQAAAIGQALPLSAAHAELLRAAVAAGDGELDNAAVIRQVRRSRADP